MKMKNKIPPISVLGQEIQDTLRDFADKEFFDTRKALNEEAVTYLHIEEDLKNDVREIRTRLKIPKLNPEDDLFTIDAFEHSIEADSNWLFRSSPQSQEVFANEIERLMREYSLPKNFHDWLQFYILYNKKPPWKPLYNWDLLEQIMKDSDEPQRIPLTTKEKKFVKLVFRYITKSKPGRPKKQHQKAYSGLLELLAQSKNTSRRMRTLKQALATLNRGEIEEDYDFEKLIKYRPTYRRFVDRKFPSITTEEELTKKANKFRKRNQRLRQRMERTTKKPKK